MLSEGSSSTVGVAVLVLAIEKNNKCTTGVGSINAYLKRSQSPFNILWYFEVTATIFTVILINLIGS